MFAEIASPLTVASGVELTLLGMDLHLEQPQQAATVLHLTDGQTQKLHKALVDLGANMNTSDAPLLLGELTPTRSIARAPSTFPDIQLRDAELSFSTDQLTIRTAAGVTRLELTEQQSTILATELQYCFKSNAPRAHTIEDDRSWTPESSAAEVKLFNEFDLRSGALPTLGSSAHYREHIERALGTKIDPRHLNRGATPAQIAVLIDKIQDEIYSRIKRRSDPIPEGTQASQALQDGLDSLRRSAFLLSSHDIETGEHFFVKGRIVSGRSQDLRLAVRPASGEPEAIQGMFGSVADFCRNTPEVNSFKVMESSFFSRRDPIVIYLKDDADRVAASRSLALSLGTDAQVRRCKGLILTKIDATGAELRDQITPTKREAFELAIRVVERLCGRPLKAEEFQTSSSRDWTRLSRTQELLRQFKS
jgi:hypothetical protein